MNGKQEIQDNTRTKIENPSLEENRENTPAEEI
jgi:hypothetical protein